MSSLLIAAREPAGFRADPRFGGITAAAPIAEILPKTDPADPLAEAFERGLAEGEARARAECDRRVADTEMRCAALFQALEGVVAVEAEELRERLRQTVLALCEEAILPLAIDPVGLARRCEAAAAMLARAQDERAIYLHPADAEFVAPLLAPGIAVRPDPALERGSLRIETADGGIEDGPAAWRRALHEAFGEC